VDHGYALYSAISRVVPEIHEAKTIGVHPTRGAYSGNGELILRDSLRLGCENGNRADWTVSEACEAENWKDKVCVPFFPSRWHVADALRASMFIAVGSDLTELGYGE
jgi:hypothetical protein